MIKLSTLVQNSKTKFVALKWCKKCQAHLKELKKFYVMKKKSLILFVVFMLGINGVVFAASGPDAPPPGYEDGPDPPPPGPINDYIPWLIIAGLVVAYRKLSKNQITYGNI